MLLRRDCMKRDKTLTKKLTLCGVMAALALALLYIGGITVLDLSVVLVCSMITMFIMIETGERMTWTYLAVAVFLAFLILPSKMYAIEYTLFGALYPILKAYIERLRGPIVWMLKLLSLNAMLAVCVLTAKFVFALGDEYFPLGVITFVLGTLFFVLYDRVLTMCVTFYIVKLRNKLKLK